MQEAFKYLCVAKHVNQPIKLAFALIEIFPIALVNEDVSSKAKESINTIKDVLFAERGKDIIGVLPNMELFMLYIIYNSS